MWTVGEPRRFSPGRSRVSVFIPMFHCFPVEGLPWGSDWCFDILKIVRWPLHCWGTGFQLSVSHEVQNGNNRAFTTENCFVFCFVFNNQDMILIRAQERRQWLARTQLELRKSHGKKPQGSQGRERGKRRVGSWRQLGGEGQPFICSASFRSHLVKRIWWMRWSDANTVA